MSTIQTNWLLTADEGFVFQKVRYFGEAAKPPLVFNHHHAAHARFQWTQDYYMDFFRALAEDYTVYAGDMGWVPGQDTWGNATHRSRVNDARLILSTYYGSTGKVTLAGASMGGLASLNYAKYYGASEVEAVALCEPLTNMWDVRDRGFSAEIDGAYAGGYTDGVYGAVYNPYVWRAGYDDDNIPTAFWTASDDPITTPIYARAFCLSNPKVSHFDLGAMGHTADAITNAITGTSGPGGPPIVSMIEWLRGYRNLVQHPFNV